MPFMRNLFNFYKFQFSRSLFYAKCSYSILSRQNVIFNNILNYNVCTSLTKNEYGLKELGYICSRSKHKMPSKNDDEDSDDDISEFKSDDSGRDSKLLKIKGTSLRVDLIIKAGLSMARNKVETVFYESRIRVNGKKIPKKSITVKVGDEIDVIKTLSPLNPNNVVISRIEVLDVKANEEDISITLRRYKSLTIDNYSKENAWKASQPEKS